MSSNICEKMWVIHNNLKFEIIIKANNKSSVFCLFKKRKIEIKFRKKKNNFSKLTCAAF